MLAYGMVDSRLDLMWGIYMVFCSGIWSSGLFG